ncbi:MAG: transposase [Nitrospinae bacterium]|nr:transposase [Nitrospinota bacterium]
MSLPTPIPDTPHQKERHHAQVAAGVTPITLPPRRPNANAHAERWVRPVKKEVLSRLFLFGEGALRQVLKEYDVRYHQERNHQGKGNE